MAAIFFQEIMEIADRFTDRFADYDTQLLALEYVLACESLNSPNPTERTYSMGIMYAVTSHPNFDLAAFGEHLSHTWVPAVPRLGFDA